MSRRDTAVRRGAVTGGPRRDADRGDHTRPRRCGTGRRPRCNPGDAGGSQPAAPVAAAPATASRRIARAGIFVPKWVAIVAAAIVAALVFGGIGYAIGDSSSDSGTTQNASVSPDTTNGQQLPGNGPFGGNQVPNGNGDGDDNGGRVRPEQRRLPRCRRAAGRRGRRGHRSRQRQPGGRRRTAGGRRDHRRSTAPTSRRPLALRAAVQEHSSGDEITVTYTRDGTSSTATVTLTSRPSQSS